MSEEVISGAQGAAATSTEATTAAAPATNAGAAAGASPAAAGAPATDTATQPIADGAGAAAPAGAQPEPEKVAPAAGMQAPAVEEDPGLKRLIEAYKGGKAKEYLEHATRDYDAMTPEQVFRAEIAQKNPEASDKLVNALLKQRMTEYEALGSLDDDAKEAAQEKMELDAKNIRDGLKEASKNFRLPSEPVVDPEVARQEAAYQAQATKIRNYLETHPDLKALQESPVVTMGEGEEAFKFTSEAVKTAALETLQDSSKLFQIFWGEPDASGERKFDMQKYAKVIAYANDTAAVENALIAHGRTLGRKAEFTERHNPNPTTAGTAPAGAGTPTVRVRRT